MLDPRDPERQYVTRLLPQKMALDRLYAARPESAPGPADPGATILMVVCRQPVAVDRTTGALRPRRRPPEIPIAAPADPSFGLTGVARGGGAHDA